MRNFTLFYADCVECQYNKFYPHKVVVNNDTASLQKAVSHDYVGAEYRNNERSNNNFMCSDCLIFDVDNTHSDTPEDWITPKHISQEFTDVAFAVHYSRNHMKEKDGKSARPKFHVLFPISSINSAQKYSELKKRILQAYPFFDSNAADAGRMFYGTRNPNVEIFDGSRTIEDFLINSIVPLNYEMIPTASTKSVGKFGVLIPQGMRNSTLYRFACTKLVRFGNTSETYQVFIEQTQLCSPPLPSEEIAVIWNNALKFYSDAVLKNPNYIPPDVFNKGYISLEPHDLTDVGQANILAKEYNNKLRHSPKMGFLTFNGAFWEESDTRARSCVHELTEQQLKEAEDRVKNTLSIIEVLKELFKRANVDIKAVEPEALKKYEADYDKAHQFYKFALKYRDSYRVSATLTEAESMLYIQPDELDSDPFFLNTKGGTYDLRCGLLNSHAHNSDDLITKCTAIAPSDKGMSIWKSFLQTIFLEDRELIEYVQQIVGLAAIGKVFIEAVIICIGNGANGKSTLWNVINRVMGTYGGTISADVLTQNCKRNPKPELADLRGVRLALASELEEGATLSTSMLKQLASTDKITAERKYKDPFTFTPSHTTVLLTNYLPEIPSGVHSKGTWRRLIVVPFNAQIESGQDVKNYADILFGQAGEAILSWIIEGAQKIINKNYHLDTPEAVLKATDVYKENNDWLQNFMNERCEIGENLTVKAGEFLAAYKDYCTYTGETNKKAGVINAALEAAGYKRQKTRSGVVIKGLRLR